MNEGNVFEDLSYFQEDESVIQDDNTESDLQFYEGNEEEIESTNINLNHAEEMLDDGMFTENAGQIQEEYLNDLHYEVERKCKKNQALTYVKSIYSGQKNDRQWIFECGRVSASILSL